MINFRKNPDKIIENKSKRPIASRSRHPLINVEPARKMPSRGCKANISYVEREEDEEDDNVLAEYDKYIKSHKASRRYLKL